MSEHTSDFCTILQHIKPSPDQQDLQATVLWIQTHVLKHFLVSFLK